MAVPHNSGNTTGEDPPVIGDPPIQVYIPPKVGNPHCVIFNNGASPVYLGGTGVSINGGLYFPPNAQLSLPYMPYGIWSVSGYTLGTAVTTLSASVTAGGTTIACGSLASMTVGSAVQIGNANAPTSYDIVTISAFVNAGTLTTTSPTLYDHISGGTVTVVASQTGSSLSVNVGTT
jgi:hypothetical protein